MSSDFKIRQYHPSDLPALYRVCLQTGDSGADATHLYRDPDLFGHIFVAPYTVYEPDLCFVLTHSGTPCGYVLGTQDSMAFSNWCEQNWFPLLRERYPMPPSDDESPDAVLIRDIYKGHVVEDDVADYPAHLHIDLLPVAQGHGLGKAMMQTLINQLRQLNIPAVHLGVSKANPRAVKFYERFGFHKISEYDFAIVFGMHL